MAGSSNSRAAEWQTIPEHTLELRTWAALPIIRLVVNSALFCPDSEVPSALGFDVEITLPNRAAAQPIQYRGRHGFYGDLAAFRDGVKAIRYGEGSRAEFHGEGIRLALLVPDEGPNSTLFVEGAVSSLLDSEFEPFDQRLGFSRWLVRDGETQHCLTFAFRMPNLDSPFMDSFVRNVDALFKELVEATGQASS